MSTSHSDADLTVFTYNATKLSPRQVARSFVAPPAFRMLRDARNAILVGPRGSGKTTLLKMLTPEGLSAWTGSEADAARKRVQDVGVFVGADAMWSEQVKSGDDPDDGAFGAAAYGLHIAKALVSTLLSRLGDSAGHLAITLDTKAELLVAARISRLFKLPVSSASLRRLTYDIGDRLTELGTYRYRILNGQILPDWAYLNPLQAVSEVSQMVNDLTGETDRHWALLFDELELAPERIVQDILRRLRGDEGTLVFKLSLAPILRSTDLLTGDSGAIHGQDVEFISLTSPDRTDRFVAEIFDKQLATSTLPGRPTPADILGESLFDSGDADRSSKTRSDPYRKGSTVWNAMSVLSKRDVSFENYLASANIDLDALGKLDPGTRAAKIRKIRNLAIVRSHFAAGARQATQATRALYAGESTMMALPDGNPRMSMILVRELMGAVSDPQNQLPLERKLQAAAIDLVTNRFMALLHAQTGIRVGTRAFTVVMLLDAVGKALHDRVVNQPFSADVPAGFFVDREVPDTLLPLLKQAVNTGAIVHIPHANSISSVSADARGRHYRLSYLLAPRYGLPLRQGKTVALTRLLDGPKPVRGARVAEQQALIDLEDIV